MQDPFISIIIPAFNEQDRIIDTLEKLEDHLCSQNYSWEMLVVDDGSLDMTAQLVQHWSKTHPNVRIESTSHGGKGSAVKYGMLSTTGKYRFMCDADLSMPVENLTSFLRWMDDGYDIVVGSREIQGASRCHEPWVRHFMGRAFNWYVSLIAVRKFKDTQCGFKCFKGTTADRLFAMQRVNGFGFDVEILYLAIKENVAMIEIPIEWHYQTDSKVNLVSDSLRMFRDTFLIKFKDLRGSYKVEDKPHTSWLQNPTALEIEDSVAVVLPTYNEAENLSELVSRIFALEIKDLKIVIVDDNSPDHTAEMAKSLAIKFDGRISIIERACKQGLGTAYLRGFTAALEEGAIYVLQMDADLSHAPEYIPDFLQALQHQDVVVGSRYVAGGGVDDDWSLLRKIISFIGNFGVRVVVGLRVKDATSGFKGFRAQVLGSLLLKSYRCKGFGFQVEMALACQQAGYKVAEYPIVFLDRTKGKSKMTFGIILETIRHLVFLRWLH